MTDPSPEFIYLVNTHFHIKVVNFKEHI